MKNTYQLSQNKDILIIIDESGDITTEHIANHDKKLKASQDSKELNLKAFDTQIEEYQRQIDFVASQTETTPQEEGIL